MSVGGSRPKSVFYINPAATVPALPTNGNSQSVKVKPPSLPRSSADEKSEGHCKASFTNQGFRYEGTIFVTKFRVVFVCDDDKIDGDSVSQTEKETSQSQRRNTNCGQKMSTFYDEYLDIPLAQIRRLYVVQQEPGANAPPANNTTGGSLAASGSPTKPNLKWLVFPSQYEPLMDFLYIQIESSNFNCCTIYFEKSQTSYQQFLNSLASRLTNSIPKQFLFMNVADTLTLSDLNYSPSEAQKTFVRLQDWISFFQNSFLINILKDKQKAGEHENVCSVIASAIFQLVYSKSFSHAEVVNFPQYCFTIKNDKQFDKFFLRHTESMSGDAAPNCSVRAAKSPIKQFLQQIKDRLEVIEVTEQLTFSPKALSQGYELLEEYLQFRFGRSRKFFKLSIKLFRTIFENSGWLLAVSNCLKFATTVADKFQKSNERIFILKNADGVPLGVSCILSSLVEVYVSPRCRTIDGFIEMIQRQWVAAGFDFKEQFPGFMEKKPKCLKRFLEDKKSSIASSKRMTKNLLKFGTTVNPSDEQSLTRTPTPYFLVFLDCIHQLTRLYPTYFEFNSPYLSQIWNFLLSGVFSDFLSPKSVSLKPSLWECIAESPNAHLFRNPSYSVDFVGDDMRPQLDARMYCCANLDVWDDLFFRYHIDCSTVKVYIDEENNQKPVLSNNRKFSLIPPPNILERNTSFDSSLQRVYEFMDVIKLQFDDVDSEWVQPKRSFHSDVNPRSFARVASSIEILDLLESGDEEDLPDGSASNNLEIATNRSNSRESTISETDWSKFSLGGDSRGPSIRLTGESKEALDLESSTEMVDSSELVIIKSTQL